MTADRNHKFQTALAENKIGDKSSKEKGRFSYCL
jgi:hypothetical protein